MDERRDGKKLDLMDDWRLDGLTTMDGWRNWIQEWKDGWTDGW